MKTRMGRRLTCYLLVILMIFGSFSAFSTPVLANDTEAGFEQFQLYADMLATFGSRYHFTNYMADHVHASRPNMEYTIDAADYSVVGGMTIRYYEDLHGVPGTSVWTDEQGLIEWSFYVSEAGLYNISVLYFNVLGRNSDIQRALFINGQQPFFEASPIEFRRIWVNQLDEIERDALGNDMRPSQVEYHDWQEVVLRDSMGTYNEPFLFYFNEGWNTIGFVSQREPMVIRQLRIHQVSDVRPYAEVSAGFTGINRPTLATFEGIRLEGQDADRKSSPMLAPQADTSGPGVYPYSPRYIRINNIGGSSWSEPGSWIEWDVYVEEEGLYKIAMNVRQNFHRGANSFRRITVNGEVPFSEMEAVGFGFRNGWRVETLGGHDSPFMFHLQAGHNTIRMEAVLGDYAPYFREIQESALILNDLYRQIVMITGLSPDVFRDYHIERRLPHLRGALEYEQARLERIFARLTEMSVGRGDRDTVIRSTAHIIGRILDDIENIPRRLLDFRINIGSLGTWIMIVRDQMLAVDAIYILPYDAPTPTNGRSWWRQIIHEILTLFFSFIIDYNTIGTSVDGVYRNVEVWIGTGRDQANVIKQMIDETFTRDTGIGVTLKLVDMATLLPATVARQGPDVTISVGNALPMDFGLRGAVADISGMPGFDEVVERFHPEAMVPFTFDGQVFGLPETMTYFMLFYRQDILHEIDLTPPDTWDEVRSAIAHLGQFHLELGIPVASWGMDITDFTYTMFLYQHGGELYNEDATRSALDSDVALNAFRDFTRFFTDYNLPREYDFINRFRAGEMPIAIADFTHYNILQVFAPEIRGMWGFRPVPGIPQEDGTINRAVPIGGVSTIMMERAADKDAAWEFMKWWTSADTQTQFGRQMESLMGAAARHPSANLEAFSRMAWPVLDYQSLLAQREHVRGIPQVPGGYFTPRQIRNAFYTTVELENIGAREALRDFVRLINDEIRAKRREFGLDY